MQDGTARTGGLAGIVGIGVPAVGLAVLPIWDFPATADTGARVAAFAAGNRAALQVTMALNTAGVTLWLVFGAAVWVRLRAELPPDSVLPGCVAVGATGFVTLLLAGFTSFDVLVYRHPGAAESQVLYDLTFGLLAMSGMPTAVATAAFATAVYRYRALPRVTGHLAAVTAVVHVLLLLSLVVPSGALSLEGLSITVVPAFLWAWILCTGVVLLRSTPRRVTGPAPAPSPRRAPPCRG